MFKKVRDWFCNWFQPKGRRRSRSRSRDLGDSFFDDIEEDAHLLTDDDLNDLDRVNYKTDKKTQREIQAFFEECDHQDGEWYENPLNNI